MDLVEAINQWIDDGIDDFDDDELEEILRVLDVIEVSDYAQLAALDIHRTDVDAMTSLFVDGYEATLAEWVILESITNPGRVAESESGEPDEIDDAAAPAYEAEWGDETTAHEEDLPPLGDGQVAPADGQPTLPLPLPSRDDQITPWLEAEPEPDELGPSFLESVGSEPPPPRSHIRHYAFVALFLAAVAAFVFGAIRLVDSLPAETSSTQTSPSATQLIEPAEPTAESRRTPEATTVEEAGAPEADEEADTAPEPAATPAGIAVIRVSSGDVIATALGDEGAGTAVTLHDASGASGSPAKEIVWFGDVLAIVTEAGDVLTVDPAATEDPELIWDTAEGLPAAVTAARLQARIAMVTDEGALALFPRGEPADVETIEVLWDPEITGSSVTGLASQADLMPFVLDNGNVQMLIASADDAIIEIWSSDSQPAAFVVRAAPTGIVMGIGGGALARYRLGEYEGPPIDSIWNPFDSDLPPSIDYAYAGDVLAVVRQDGGVVLVDAEGTIDVLWDPEATEVPALAIAASATNMLLLLDTGSVISIPLEGDRLPISSIWDITDVTRSAAVQVLLVTPPD